MSPQPAPHYPIAFRVLKGAVNKHITDSEGVDLVSYWVYVIVLIVDQILGTFGDDSIVIEITLYFQIKAGDIPV